MAILYPIIGLVFDSGAAAGSRNTVRCLPRVDLAAALSLLGCADNNADMPLVVAIVVNKMSLTLLPK